MTVNYQIDDVVIKSPEALSEIATARLVEEYNMLTGKSIKKFSDRATAEKRVWDLIAETAAAPEEPKPSTSTGRKGAIDRKATIWLQVEENPKREGSSSYARFEKYTDGMTVDAYLKEGGHLADIRWDNEKNFISLELPEKK